MVVMEERAMGGPGRELRSQHDRQYNPTGERTDDGDPAAGGAGCDPGSADACACGSQRLAHAREMPEDVRRRQNPHTMKLTLWIESHGPRSCGPSNISTMPLANTITVETTTIGAIRRRISSGGPFFL